MKPDWVGEDQVSTVIFSDQALIHQLICLGGGFALIADVEVTDIRTEGRIEAAAVRVLDRPRGVRR
ncbi:MAG: hypothetical protein ACREQN_15015 [Candidatus Binataceae bacterium]